VVAVGALAVAVAGASPAAAGNRPGPRSVTLFGESAGGLSVLSQLASPGARGLFDRAVVESGTYDLTQAPLASAETSGAAFAAKAGCATNTAAGLRGRPLSTIIDNENFGGYDPDVDGRVLTQSIGPALASGQFNRMPVIIGTNHDEWRLFVALDQLEGGAPVTAANYQASIASTLGVSSTAAAVVASQYPLSDYASPPVALGAVGTGAIFACHALTAEQSLAKYVPTYAYEFNDENAPEPFLPPTVPLRRGARVRDPVPVPVAGRAAARHAVRAAAATGGGHETGLDGPGLARVPRLRLAPVHQRRPAVAVAGPAAAAGRDQLLGRAPLRVLVPGRGLTAPVRSPADRRPVGGPAHVGGHLGRGDDFRGGHEAHADHGVEVALLCPFGQRVASRARIRVPAAGQDRGAVYDLAVLQAVRQRVGGGHRNAWLGHRASIPEAGRPAARRHSWLQVRRRAPGVRSASVG
jgi:hypothetical protein